MKIVHFVFFKVEVKSFTTRQTKLKPPTHCSKCSNTVRACDYCLACGFTLDVNVSRCVIVRVRVLNLHVRECVCCVTVSLCVFQLEQRALTEQLKVDEPEGPVGVGKNSPKAD